MFRKFYHTTCYQEGDFFRFVYIVLVKFYLIIIFINDFDLAYRLHPKRPLSGKQM